MRASNENWLTVSLQRAVRGTSMDQRKAVVRSGCLSSARSPSRVPKRTSAVVHSQVALSLAVWLPPLNSQSNSGEDSIVGMVWSISQCTYCLPPTPLPHPMKKSHCFITIKHYLQFSLTYNLNHHLKVIVHKTYKWMASWGLLNRTMTKLCQAPIGAWSQPRVSLVSPR